MTYDWEASAAKALKRTDLNVNLPEHLHVFGVFVVNTDAGEGAYVAIPTVDGILLADALKDAVADASAAYNAVVAELFDFGERKSK